MTWNIPWGEIFLVLHTLAVLLCALRVLYKQQNTGTAFAWLILLFLLPGLGVALYVLIGEPRLGTARAKRRSEMNRFYQTISERYLDGEYGRADAAHLQSYGHINQVAAGETGFDVTHGNKMQLLNTTDSIVEAILADIRSAKISCSLAFYIIEPKGRIEAVLQAVEEASERGVECMLLADAVGSKNFWRSAWPERLRMRGVEVQESLPVGMWRTLFVRTDLRNHRKLLIVDKKIAYTGSFNLVDPRFFKQDSGVGEWVDVMMRCTGPVALQMAAVFYADMAVESERSLIEVQSYLNSIDQLALPPATGSVNAQVIPSAPNVGDKVIHSMIICALYAARERIVITTPYFVPDDPLLTALTIAARRGVDVTLILPAKVDSLMVRYASRAYYPMLLRAGVNIALFDGGLLHAKTMTIDDNFSLFGTVNMDMRSFFLNLEVSLAIYDVEVTQTIFRQQQNYLANSHYVDVKAWQMRAKWWGLVENSVRLMGPLL